MLTFMGGKRRKCLDNPRPAQDSSLAVVGCGGREILCNGKGERWERCDEPYPER